MNDDDTLFDDEAGVEPGPPALKETVQARLNPQQASPGCTEARPMQRPRPVGEEHSRSAVRQISEPLPAEALIQKLLGQPASLVEAIEQVLTFLEDRSRRGERLPADSVDVAAILIRMVSRREPRDISLWLERERARRLAAAFRQNRWLGSEVGLAKKKKWHRLPPPPRPAPSEEPPAPSEESGIITLCDLVKSFEELLERIA